MGGITTPTLYTGTYSTIYAAAIARIRSNAPDYTALLPADPGVAILDAMLYEMHQVGIAVNDMVLASLVAWLNYIGVEVKGAIAAKAVVTISLEEQRAADYIVPAGSKFLTADGVPFSSEAEAVIPAGQLTCDVPVACEIRGIKGNVRAHEIAVMYQHLPYVQSVDNAEAASGGYASELDAAALERGRHRLSYLDRAVTLADHEHMACEVPGIARAKALDVGGAFMLYLVDDAGAAPTALKNAEVLEYFSGKRGVWPFAVYAAEFVGIDITANVRFLPGFPTATAREAVRAKLAAYMNPLTWPWGSANADTRAVYISEIVQSIEETAGVDAIEEMLFPLANLRLGRHQLPRLGEVTLNAL